MITVRSAILADPLNRRTEEASRHDAEETGERFDMPRFILRLPARMDDRVEMAIPVARATSVHVCARDSRKCRSISTSDTAGRG